MTPTLSAAPEAAAMQPMIDLLRGRRVVVLAGAGCSTDSGIPDYRGPQGSLRTRKPMQFQEFVRSEPARARYWARSAVGWLRFSAARPNAAHHALAELESAGVVRGIITQNVDGLHHAAGSRRVVELHGTLDSVRCLGCGELRPRADFQRELMEMNPGWADRLLRPAAVEAVEQAPDGDAELPDEAYDGFRVPPCAGCGGVIKPDVVFFGENVPREWVDDAWRLFGEGEVLLVVGSSLHVYSGRRFIYRANEQGVPIAILNLGPTRADELAAARLEAPLGDSLPRIADTLLRHG
jgi:NAD-dependent SIR2 family protein deacetylase